MNNRYLILMTIVLFVFGSCTDNQICFDAKRQVITAKSGGIYRIYLENKKTNTVFQIDKKQGLRPINELNISNVDTAQYEILKLGLKKELIFSLPLVPNSNWTVSNVSFGDAASFDIDLKINENRHITSKNHFCR